MKNKISYSNMLAIFLLLGLSVLAYGAFALEKNTPIKLDLTTNPLSSSFSILHFNAGGNDFGGGTLWVSTQTPLEQPKEIQTPRGERKLCSSKIEGIYYNSQRGERLWPLDEKSLAVLRRAGTQYDHLGLLGGFYTNCGSGDEKSIYGSVEHQLPGQEPYVLIAGVQYDIPSNRMKADSSLHCSLQILGKQQIVGYLYDSQ